MQEPFYGPYFCAEQQTKWYDLTEKIPDGPTTKLMCEVAKRHNMVLVVPIYEEDMSGVYYNTASVIDADGKWLGKFRKIHIPQVNPGFWRNFISGRLLASDLPGFVGPESIRMVYFNLADLWSMESFDAVR